MGSLLFWLRTKVQLLWYLMLQLLLQRSITTKPSFCLKNASFQSPAHSLSQISGYSPFQFSFSCLTPLLHQPYHPIPKSPPSPPRSSSLLCQLLQHLHSCTRLTICNPSHDSSPNITDHDYSLSEKLQWNLHLFLEEVQEA